MQEGNNGINPIFRNIHEGNDGINPMFRNMHEGNDGINPIFRNMHEGNDGINPIFPFPTDVSGFPYNAGSTQLQPIQAPDTGFNLNMNINNLTTTTPELNLWQQQNLPISLNNRFQHQENGGAILNTDHISMGLELGHRHNYSIANDGGNIGAPQPRILSISDGLSSLLDCYNQELDAFMELQETYFKNGITQLLHKQNIYNLNMMMGINQRLQAKEVEMMNMNMKNMELKERINQLANEAQSWQTKAKHNESLVFALEENLEQTLVNCGLKASESCGDNIEMDSNRLNNCKNCGLEGICVLLLPCRHLCLCERCDHLPVSICPVCQVKKSSSIKVLVP